MSPTQSKALAVIDDWTPFILGIEQLPYEESEDIVERIQRDILEQHTSADILAAGELIPSDELVGHPLRFTDAELRRGSFDTGINAYCVVKCESLETGEQFQVTCGGSKVIAKLWAHKRDTLFPFEGIFTSRRTSKDRTVKSIVALPEHRAAIPADAEVVDE